jgi:uncharacterized membrane protein YccC
MLSSRDYLREIQKFTTSQYWNAGVRITAGVMLPTLILAHYGWLTVGMPFLYGALFVSITDMPGPIHHRRNGLIAAIALNTITVLLTGLIRDNQLLLITEIVVFSFSYSLLGVFGNRAGAIGVLALVIMLLNMLPHQDHNPIAKDTLLIFCGGVWYTGFSLLLYRLRPYRLAEQAVGENLIATAAYLQARASLYKEGVDISKSFHRVMEEQSTVLKCQDQAREILFKTRQFVGDASPKSRSIMMVFIDSIDLLEQTMTAYQDYQLLHRTLDKTGLLNKFYGVILQLAAELEHIGLLIQSGAAIRKDITFTSALGELVDALNEQRNKTTDVKVINSIQALDKGLDNLKHIAGLMQRLVRYTRFEIDVQKSYPSLVEVNTAVIGQPIRWQEIRENLTLKSNTFRHALRLTMAMVIGYTVSIYFSLSHVYWVLLTIVTILKPVYTVSRTRNIQRVSGTLVGAFIAIVLLYFISSTVALFIILIISMIMGYSFLRVNYFGFVLFLTLYIIISFHFLNPGEFNILIKERLIDTVVGSVIAAITARYILPVWGSEEIESYMLEMLSTAEKYFEIAWLAQSGSTGTQPYKLARKDAVVALTNLSENFQRILSEPKQARQSLQLHQFVIASHLLTGHIAALNNEKLAEQDRQRENVFLVLGAIKQEFKRAANKLNHKPDEYVPNDRIDLGSGLVPPQLLTIYNLVHDIRLITGRMQVS